VVNSFHAAVAKVIDSFDRWDNEVEDTSNVREFSVAAMILINMAEPPSPISSVLVTLVAEFLGECAPTKVFYVPVWLGF
jgi:hypothetical protein